MSFKRSRKGSIVLNMEDKTASDATNYLLSKVNHKSYGK